MRTAIRSITGCLKHKGVRVAVRVVRVAGYVYSFVHLILVLLRRKLLNSCRSGILASVTRSRHHAIIVKGPAVVMTSIFVILLFEAYPANRQ